jgi:hypothetical protein
MRRVSLAIAAILIALGTSAGSQGGTARIVSPADGTFVTGAVRLAIAFEPMSLVTDVRLVRWFADARQVCTVERPPFTCEWDAGELMKEHVIRAVAVLKDGQQVVANARTKTLDVAEAVDVDVLQITAVVTDRDGRFVTDLTARDFKVYDDDRLQPLTQFGSEKIPLELVAAVDTSSSMADALPSGRARHGFPLAAAARRSGDRPRVQRQHPHAGAAIHRSDGPRACDQSSEPVGRHRAVRRHHQGAGSARPPAGAPVSPRLQRRRRPVESRLDGHGDPACRGVGRHDLMLGQGRAPARGLQQLMRGSRR